MTSSPAPSPPPPPPHLAGEALWMPLCIHGRDEALHDGSITPLATRSILLIIALPTKCLGVFLVESLGSKVLPTQRAEEMLRVPGLVQGTHHSLRGVCVVCVGGG